ncbi:ABC transporter permease [Neobacillus niacini]|uniref:ABC transporter permease n=1 Tax=Neobacillus niacini TaxID=86668 RepID=UPI0021CB07DE|nr:ABC transporter permease [Neobacillus niacini]MCM3763962.1 ABC transporter permease [Neobacillus niacini]
MNIVHKLTLRHLKQNKRRTLVTIIGVIISVAMVTAVATLFVSFMKLMQQQTIADRGEWHVLYHNVNKEQLDTIQHDPDTKTVVLSRDRGYALLPGGKNESKPYLFIKEYNPQGFNHFPVELTKGRLPKAANEVVLSEHIATNGKVEYKIGDTLALEVGDRFLKNEAVQFFQTESLQTEDDQVTETLKNLTPATYKVVGFIKRPNWEPTWSPGYTVISYLDESSIGDTQPVNASVILKKVEKSLYDHAEELAQKNNIAPPQFNSELLRYYGVTNNDSLQRTLTWLSAIIMAVIIIGSVSLIYNAFAISVSERARHLGMLASVGATKQQKRNSVFFEGAVIGAISIPIGILAGLAGIGITFYFINSMLHEALGTTEKLTLTVTPLSLLSSCAISLVTIFISTYIPARRASRVSAIDAIRQTQDIKLTQKAVKTSKITRRLFGIEAEIGLKNLKRSKRRYQATLFSLIISIVLFLSVSFFTANLKKSLDLSQDGTNFDIQVIVGRDGEIDEPLIQRISSLDYVTEFSVVQQLSLNTWINKAEIADEFRKPAYKESFKDGKFPYFIQLHALDQASLKDFSKKAGADYDELSNPSKLAGIVIETIQYQDPNSGKYVETKAIHAKAGQSIDLLYMDSETQEEAMLDKVTIAALTDQFPIGISPAGLGGLDIIVSEQTMNRLAGNEKLADGPQTFVYLKSTDPMKTQQEIEDLKDTKLAIYNAYQSRQRGEQMIMLMSVFTYGFIALITAISIANIFNTISTSISLRKREFAMLKSVGMTPKSFNKMINYESIFYGIKSLLYGLPISIAIMYLIYRAMMYTFSYGFSLPWLSIIFAVAAVFVIVGSAMLYSGAKVKKQNIIDALKQESI